MLVFLNMIGSKSVYLNVNVKEREREREREREGMINNNMLVYPIVCVGLTKSSHKL